MTGITNEMVRQAPKFYEIARRVVEMTEDAVIVAHNATFDYSFIREEFERLGYQFKRRFLCTVKLSRKTFPGHKSYSLGNICNDLGIHIHGRHRAGGDALATVKLFEMILKSGNGQPEPSYTGINERLKRSLLDNMPDDTGVYYFYDEKGDLIYIGKSKNIYKRVQQHFINDSSMRALEMRARIADISYELTGSELIALLLESAEIKDKMPVYNRSQRRKLMNYGVYSQVDGKGYIRLEARRISGRQEPHITFSSSVAGKGYLFSICARHGLCQSLCGLYDASGPCFQHSIGLCRGACMGREDPEVYNERVIAALEPLQFETENFLVIDKGRNADERSVVAVKNGRYLGYAFLSPDLLGQSPESVLEYVNYREDNKDVRMIIRSYLRNNKVLKVLRF
jgi:DNA polymerase-3 subunit epsilon